MSDTQFSPQAFCSLLLSLGPDERYERLKQQSGTQLFFNTLRLLPSQVKKEYGWFEKRVYLESILVRAVSAETVSELVKRETKTFGPVQLHSLLELKRDGDEIWLFEAVPGDRGYALIREGRIVHYSILEIISI